VSVAAHSGRRQRSLFFLPPSPIKRPSWVVLLEEGPRFFWDSPRFPRQIFRRVFPSVFGLFFWELRDFYLILPDTSVFLDVVFSRQLFQSS